MKLKLIILEEYEILKKNWKWKMKENDSFKI
jgi:hypothetical protein